MEVAGSDWDLVVRLEALRLGALRFVILFDTGLGAALGALSASSVVRVIGNSI